MIWCVEDDASIRDIEIYALRSMGLEADGFEDGTTFWAALERECPDLIVLDVMLPGLDGIELLKRIKSSARLKDIPVIMATAKGEEYDKVQGLDLGADYYLVKPFGIMEFVACVKAVLRRYGPKETNKNLKIAGVELNPAEHTVFADGNEVILTVKEYELLRLFMTNPGVAFTRDQLMEKVWGVEYCGETRTVDMHIRTLRQKLGPRCDIIKTIRGVGYRLEVRT
jgi:two-component system, OmpR family, alkaline phosphatase synthesis response regulator PhoP